MIVANYEDLGEIICSEPAHVGFALLAWVNVPAYHRRTSKKFPFKITFRPLGRTAW